VAMSVARTRAERGNYAAKLPCLDRAAGISRSADRAPRNAPKRQIDQVIDSVVDVIVGVDVRGVTATRRRGTGIPVCQQYWMTCQGSGVLLVHRRESRHGPWPRGFSPYNPCMSLLADLVNTSRVAATAARRTSARTRPVSPGLPSNEIETAVNYLSAKYRRENRHSLSAAGSGSARGCGRRGVVDIRS
jgi:hypothetical protein